MAMQSGRHSNLAVHGVLVVQGTADLQIHTHTRTDSLADAAHAPTYTKSTMYLSALCVSYHLSLSFLSPPSLSHTESK